MPTPNVAPALKPQFDNEGRLVMKPVTPTAKAGSAQQGATQSSEIDSLPGAEQRASDARSLAQDRRAAQKRAATEKAAAEKKEKAREDAKAKKSEPARYWVQIASGSYKPDLDKEWDKQKSLHGKQLAGKTPWTTPFRGTNRLLIGPFPSKSAAQDYVNDARGAGFSCLPVTTPSGQKVERLN